MPLGVPQIVVTVEYLPVCLLAGGAAFLAGPANGVGPVRGSVLSINQSAAADWADAGFINRVALQLDAAVALRTSCENLSHNLQKRKSV